MRPFKISYALAAAALLATLIASGAKANSILTYQGNAYTDLTGSYETGGPYALTITLDTTLTGSALDSISDVNITSTIKSYEITDGSSFDLTSSNNTEGFFDFYRLSTDASGGVVGWDVEVGTPLVDEQGEQMTSADFVDSDPEPVISDESSVTTGTGDNRNDAGEWTVTTVAAPEPATWALLLGGLGLLAFFRFSRTLPA